MGNQPSQAEPIDVKVNGSSGEEEWVESSANNQFSEKEEEKVIEEMEKMEAKHDMEDLEQHDHQDEERVAEGFNLVNYYLDTHRFDLALPLMVANLEKRRMTLGEDNPFTIDSAENCAMIYLKMGEYELSELLHLDCVNRRQRLLHWDHSDTMRSLHRLGTFYIHWGKPERARAILIEAFAKRERVLGPDHPETLQSMNALGVCLQILEDLDEALLMLELTLKRRLKVDDVKPGNGKVDHPDTLEVMCNLARLHALKKDWAKAIQLQVYVVDKRVEILSELHPDSITAIVKLASMYGEMNVNDKSQQLYGRAITLSSNVMGPEHPATLDIVNSFRADHPKMSREVWD